MNRLCKDLEKWSDSQRYSAGVRNAKFDYHIMIDDSIQYDEKKQTQINKIYVDFCKTMQKLLQEQNYIKKYGDSSLSKYDAQNFTINWGYYYDIYRNKCREVSNDEKELANMAVRACYEFHPQKNNTKFLWRVAAQGILQNIKQVSIALPYKDDNGQYEYLGMRYSLKTITKEDEDNN